MHCGKDKFKIYLFLLNLIDHLIKSEILQVSTDNSPVKNTS